jgi:hypothetical protein
MRTRDYLTHALLGLALAACAGAVQPGSGESATTTTPLAAQSRVPWPPQPVANRPEGAVPDFSAKNDQCLLCHGDILDVKTARPDVVNLHRRHLQSKKTAYQGRNRDCLTCHEMWTPTKSAIPKEGWFVMNDIYHPNWAHLSEFGSSKLIVRPEVTPSSGMVQTLHPVDPDPYKPVLKRLVCVECHGPDSKIKTFYGAPQAER